MTVSARTGREQSQQTMRAVAGYSITSSARSCIEGGTSAAILFLASGA
jgi:hypothetical protein